MKQLTDKELDEMLHKIWACKTITPVGVIWSGSRAHLDSFIQYVTGLNMTSRIFPAFCRSMGLAEPVAEHRFHATRRWRLDWAWPERLIALEVEGGVWTQGRHTRPLGFLADCEKYNEAAALGWRILRCQPKTLCTVATVELVRRAMGQTGA